MGELYQWSAPTLIPILHWPSFPLMLCWAAALPASAEDWRYVLTFTSCRDRGPLILLPGYSPPGAPQATVARTLKGNQGVRMHTCPPQAAGGWAIRGWLWGRFVMWKSLLWKQSWVIYHQSWATEKVLEMTTIWGSQTPPLNPGQLHKLTLLFWIQSISRAMCLQGSRDRSKVPKEEEYLKMGTKRKGIKWL